MHPLRSHNLASLLSTVHIFVAVTKIRGTKEVHIFVCIRKNDALIQKTRPKQKVLLEKIYILCVNHLITVRPVMI